MVVRLPFAVVRDFSAVVRSSLVAWVKSSTNDERQTTNELQKAAA